MAVWASAWVLNFTKAQPVDQEDMIWSVRRRTNSHTNTETETETHMCSDRDAGGNRSFPPQRRRHRRQGGGGSWASTTLRSILEKPLGDVSHTTDQSHWNLSCKLSPPSLSISLFPCSVALLPAIGKYILMNGIELCCRCTRFWKWQLVSFLCKAVG